MRRQQDSLAVAGVAVTPLDTQLAAALEQACQVSHVAAHMTAHVTAHVIDHVTVCCQVISAVPSMCAICHIMHSMLCLGFIDTHRYIAQQCDLEATKA